MKRQLENSLKHALSEVDRYVDKVAEIFDSISNTSLTRLCKVLRKIEKEHCRGLVSMADIFKELPYVYNIIELINSRANKTPEMYDDSSDDKLFENACCIDAEEEVCENVCSDENESILKKTIQNNFSAINLDLVAVLPEGSRNTKVKQINSLLKQLTFFEQLFEQKQDEVISLYNSIKKGGAGDANTLAQTGPLFEEGTYGWQIKESEKDYVEKIDKAIFNKKKIHSVEKSEQTLIDDLHHSKYFKGLIKTVIQEISSLEKASDYISEQCPIQCLCNLHMRDQVIRKSLLTYESFIDMRKHMYNYILNKMISMLLRAPEGTKGSDYTEFIKNYDALNIELKNTHAPADYNAKGKLYAINKIMRRNFEMYIDFNKELGVP